MTGPNDDSQEDGFAEQGINHVQRSSASSLCHQAQHSLDLSLPYGHCDVDGNLAKPLAVRQSLGTSMGLIIEKVHYAPQARQ